ncbi:MAG: hypothetical protein CMO72_07340 [Verrucomicrobiales bacterium]|mgnify:FL=1|nr:hypothetical protein [Verrucomicrobiales bacterium]|tara:strand:+ start:6260 stop:6967 length:708 start_codon:yes stop_codon:yes gene_type:complete
MNIEHYWHDIDSRLEQLLEKGFVKLPSLSMFDLDFLANSISDEMGSLTFKELGSAHKNFLDSLSVDKYLNPKLIKIAQDVFNFKGDISNQYHVARKVEPGNSKEMFRAHFDSHLFTMVLPIKIPEITEEGTTGDLIYFPYARKAPSNEISNFIGKAYYKKYASKEGMEKFSSHSQKKVDNFRDYEPLLFIGNTTLHTNYPVSLGCSSYRLTLLAHFFDPSPKYGVGGLLRLIRNR